MRPLASLRRRAPGRMVADAVHRCSDLLRRVGLSCGFLCLRSARAASAHVEKTNFVSAMLTRPRRWAFPQQRTRCAGSAFQSSIRFYTHSQVWNRTQIAAVADLQISAGETDVAIGGAGFRDLFHLLPLLRDRAWPVPLGALPAHVPRRFPLCLSLFIRQPLAKNQSGRLTRGRRNSRVTNSNYPLKRVRMFRPLTLIFSLVSLAPALFATQLDPSHQLIISIRDQKLMLVQNGAKVATYPVSTSKFGLGDFWGRMTTPLGYLAVAKKIGDHAPVGAVFHNRRFTGEILAPNAPGRDPVITRIIWLRGLEGQNAHAFLRCIYIHGTPEEKTIGRPASYGCIRMKSSDITALYNQVPLGAIVQIVPDGLPKVAKSPPAPSVNTLMARGEESKNQDQISSAHRTDKATPLLNKRAAIAQNSPRA